MRGLSRDILAIVSRMKISKRILVLFAYILCEWFIIVPDPLPMALFVFVAQPCFALAALIYILEVIEELQQRGVL
ncbi:MAG: hypothetical protein ACE5FZ_07315 [Nitrospiria bacterium]